MLCCRRSPFCQLKLSEESQIQSNSVSLKAMSTTPQMTNHKAVSWRVQGVGVACSSDGWIKVSQARSACSRKDQKKNKSRKLKRKVEKKERQTLEATSMISVDFRTCLSCYFEKTESFPSLLQNSSLLLSSLCAPIFCFCCPFLENRCKQHFWKSEKNWTWESTWELNFGAD